MTDLGCQRVFFLVLEAKRDEREKNHDHDHDRGFAAQVSPQTTGKKPSDTQGSLHVAVVLNLLSSSLAPHKYKSIRF